MLRIILKGLFPPVFLKRVFLLYNALRIRTIDRLFFPELKIDPKAFLVFKEVNPFLGLNIKLDSYSGEVREGLRMWLDPKWTQDEYLLTFNGPGFIEPTAGWGITPEKKLIYPSLGFSRAPHVPRPRFFKSIARREVSFDKIISLRDTGEENYFHFFNDVISKLFFARDNGVDLSAYTIIVSNKLYERDYFREIVKSTGLDSLKWHAQEDEWIRFGQAVFCKPLTHTKQYFDEAVQRLTHEPAERRTRKLFVTRRPESLRFVENMESVMPILQRHGFEVVDPGGHSLSRQVELFSQCSHLIGVHGAGMTNMIFRGERPMTVLEIVHPFKYIPFHYMMLSRQFNFNHLVLVGRKGKQSARGGFHVELDKLDEAIGKMM